MGEQHQCINRPFSVHPEKEISQKVLSNLEKEKTLLVKYDPVDSEPKAMSHICIV